jgi:hypothetical protein
MAHSKSRILLAVAAISVVLSFLCPASAWGQARISIRRTKQGGVRVDRNDGVVFDWVRRSNGDLHVRYANRVTDDEIIHIRKQGPIAEISAPRKPTADNPSTRTVVRIHAEKTTKKTFRNAMEVIKAAVGSVTEKPQTTTVKLPSHSTLKMVLATRKEIRDVSSAKMKPEQFTITRDYFNGQNRALSFEVAGEGFGTLYLLRDSASGDWNVDNVIFIRDRDSRAPQFTQHL